MTTVTVTTTGAGSFTIPAGVSEITFEGWGAGGGGGTGGGASCEGGGGGGAYISVTYSVTEGDIIYFNVGAGGAAGVGGGTNERTWFNKNTNSDVNANGAYRAPGGPSGDGTGSATPSNATGGETGTVVNSFTGGAARAAQGGGGSRRGSGGGGSAGPAGAGAQGTAGSGNTTGGLGGDGNNADTDAQGGAGGSPGGTGESAADGDGGGGGGGGSSGQSGGAGGAPGGGGGGGGSSSGASGTGARGQIRYTYTVTGATLTAEGASFALTGTAALGHRTMVADNGNPLVASTFDSDAGWTLTGTPNPATISGGVLTIPTGNSSTAITPLPQSYPAGTSFAFSIDRLGTSSGLGNTVFRFKDASANSNGVGLGGTGAATIAGVITISQTVEADSCGVTSNGAASTDASFDNLSVSLITYSHVGTAATFTVGILFPGESGSYALTGTAATLRHGWMLSAAAGSFALTGTAATLTYDAGELVMVAEPPKPNLITNGTFDSGITGWTAYTDSDLSWQSGKIRVTRVHATNLQAAFQTVDTSFLPYTLTADFTNPSNLTALVSAQGGDVTSTASSGTLTSAFVGDVDTVNAFLGILASSGSAGQFVEFDNVELREVSFIISGTAATFSRTRSLLASAGAYSLSGTAANLLWGRRLVAASGSYALTGTVASLLHAQRLVADAGSYALTGTAATLARGKGFAADAGGYALTGSAASLYHGWKLAAAGGSYALSGTAASFLAGAVLTADAGAYSLTGTASAFLRGFALPAASGSYALTGTASSFPIGRSILATPGSYALTGTAAVFTFTSILTALSGSYILTGLAASFTIGDISDMVPARRQLIVFRHQEAEIVRVPKLNAVAAQAAVHQEDVVSMEELSHIAPIMGLEVHVWDAPGGYTPVFGDGFSWRRISDGSVLWPTAGGEDFTVVATRSELADTTGQAALLLESGRQGVFIWEGTDFQTLFGSSLATVDAAQGLYVAPSTDPTGASGAWVRRFDGPINPTWFGLSEAGTGAANDAAILNLFATLGARGYSYTAAIVGLEPVQFPPGVFNFSSTIEFKDGSVDFAGSHAGGFRHVVTELRFPAGVTGIRVQASNTSGATGAAVATHPSGSGSKIHGFAIRGGYSTSNTEGEFHGIQLRGNAHISDIFIEGFEGDGIHAEATAGSGTIEGNVNRTQIIDVRIEDCRKGVYFNGADANICRIENVDSTSCRQWGFHDSGFLGNNYISCHSSGCGTVPGSHPPSVVTNSGNRYTVVAGQEAGASTNAPSGTTADNTWWYYLGVGGADAGQQIAEWVSGTTYRPGGSYLSDGSGAFNHFIGCYQEGTTGIAQFSDLSLVLRGKIGAYRGGAVLSAASSGYVNIGKFRVTDTLRVEGATALFGSQTIGNLTVNFDTGSSTNTMTLRSTSGTTQTDAQLISTRNSGLTIRGFGAAGAQGNVNLASGNTVVARSQSTGLNVLSGFAYYQNNVQVVGAQQAAVADATGGATVDTEARAAINALLARLRTHGLIAT